MIQFLHSSTFSVNVTWSCRQRKWEESGTEECAAPKTIGTVLNSSLFCLMDLDHL